jgi:universal stress protein A
MPYPFRVILVPIQFDDPALVALGVAKKMAKDMGATIHLHHVVPILPAIGEAKIADTAHIAEEGKAKQSLQQIADREMAGVKYQIHTNVAAPNETAEAIIRLAKEIDADLIVLKTHGRQGLAHLIMGSVAEEVVRTAPCMVLALTSSARDRAARAQ